MKSRIPEGQRGCLVERGSASKALTVREVRRLILCGKSDEDRRDLTRATVNETTARTADFVVTLCKFAD